MTWREGRIRLIHTSASPQCTPMLLVNMSFTYSSFDVTISVKRIPLLDEKKPVFGSVELDTVKNMLEGRMELISIGGEVFRSFADGSAVVVAEVVERLHWRFAHSFSEDDCCDVRTCCSCHEMNQQIMACGTCHIWFYFCGSLISIKKYFIFWKNSGWNGFVFIITSSARGRTSYAGFRPFLLLNESRKELTLCFAFHSLYSGFLENRVRFPFTCQDSFPDWHPVRWFIRYGRQSTQPD